MSFIWVICHIILVYYQNEVVLFVDFAVFHHFLSCCSSYPFILNHPNVPSLLPVYAQEDAHEVDPLAETDDIDDILEASIEEPEEADDDITYDAEEDEPVIMKSLNFNMHPLTDIPEPSSDIEVSYKFLTGTLWCMVFDG